MTLPFDYSDYVASYECVGISGGPRVHFVSKPLPPDVFSVSVTVNFGGAHLLCADNDGTVHELPQGLAHFMEHFLFWHNFEQLVEMEGRYLESPNAVTTYDSTSWELRLASVRGGKLDESVCDVVRCLLSSLLTNGIEPERLTRLIVKTSSDVDGEMDHRRQDPYYNWRLELLQALYRQNPVRYDMLGTSDSINKISAEHVALASTLIKRYIQSVTIVVNEASDKLTTKVERTIGDLLPDKSAIPDLTLMLPQTEPAEAPSRTHELQHPFPLLSYTPILFGVKLPPLQQLFPSEMEFLRMYLLCYLLLNEKREYLAIGGLLSRHARAYFVESQVEDPFFYWDPWEIVQIVRRCKEYLLQKLNRYRKLFEPAIKRACHNTLDHPNDVMNLCQAADLFGYKLTDLLDAMGLIQAQDIDYLIGEIEEAQDNVCLAYQVEDVGSF